MRHSDASVLGLKYCRSPPESDFSYFPAACRNAAALGRRRTGLRSFGLRVNPSFRVAALPFYISRVAKKLYRWSIYRTGKSPSVYLGSVHARDEKTAIEEAIKDFGITDPEQQKRLMALREGNGDL